MEKRSVIFIETPSHLLQPPPEETSTQTIMSSTSMSDQNYITHDNFQRHLRYFNSVWEPLPRVSAGHIAVSGLSAYPLAFEHRTIEITRRDIRDRAAAGPPQAMPGGEPTVSVSYEGVVEPQAQPVSPVREPPETLYNNGGFRV